jgi:hypothetical protein
MKVCNPALEADFAEIAAPGAYLAQRQTRPQSRP